MKHYDYLIVGSGLFGAVFAHQAKQKGKRCLVIDRRKHAGGNVFCKEVQGIQVHQYGAHIFHTNDKAIWDFVNSFVPFTPFAHAPETISNSVRYHLPLNMNTFKKVWGITAPEEAKKIIEDQIAQSGIVKATNLQEQAILMVGTELYEKFIKGYTEKQWGRSCTDLPASIIKRLPVRYTYDNNYFDDRYQGIPEGGYNPLVSGLLEGIEVRLDVDYFANRAEWNQVAQTIVFTGKIDEFYEYRLGELEYRSLRFEEELLNQNDFQGNAVVNYADGTIPYTRIIEHKHFEKGNQPVTVITKEYPLPWKQGLEPYYPVNDERNTQLFKQYELLSKQESNVVFGGRLYEYRYYDMHQVIGSALISAKRNIK